MGVCCVKDEDPPKDDIKLVDTARLVLVCDESDLASSKRSTFHYGIKISSKPDTPTFIAMTPISNTENGID